MADDTKILFQQIGAETEALRLAVLTSDLAALERHTTVLQARLEELRLSLKESRHGLVEERYILNGKIRSVLSLLERARRTVRALFAVSRSFSHSSRAIITEQP